MQEIDEGSAFDEFMHVACVLIETALCSKPGDFTLWSFQHRADSVRIIELSRGANRVLLMLINRTSN